MFNKKDFSNILQKINSTYSTMTEFAQNASFDRSYISKYINLKLDNPPTPKILEKISNASRGVTTYAELMKICGYSSFITQNIYDNNFNKIKEDFVKIGLSHELINRIYYLFSNHCKDETFSQELSILLDELPIDKVSETYIIINKLFKIQETHFEVYQRLLTRELKKRNIKNSEPINIKKETFNNTTLCRIPIVGKIAAGQPILAQENIEGYLPVEPQIYGMNTADDLFYLLVSGRSMDLKVKNGDYALIHKQDYAENGDIIVAIVNGDDEATLKKYKKLNEQFVLLEPMSTDPTIEAITVDLKNTPFQIIGKAIGQFGKF